ncbi:hypothetical protein SDC9_119333 [bioreactor metagenome]|uniref:Uncharacterized protein n=1 Tax=bioreactor metagenome TaxID=1076179 RepID=A0A645C3L2_9ZZZZ
MKNLKHKAKRIIQNKKGDKMDISEAVKVIALHQF